LVLAGIALSHGRIASAQVYPPAAGPPDQAFWFAADSAVDEGDVFLVPPDSEVGLPILWPPDGDVMPMGGGWPTVEVVRPRLVWNQQEEEWEYDWDPVLCPRKKAPGNCQGGSLVARGGPYPGGTYNWEFDETQHNDYAFYQSTQTGLTYYTWVSYTNWGKTSQEADTGFIRVFDADLTFQGGSTDSQDTVEDDPGFFMAKGTRKSLAISLSPADPDDVMPSSFDEDLHPRGLLPPYQVSVSQGGACCVDFYAAQQGGSPLTYQNLLWGWTEVEYEVFEETPTTPAQIYVQAETAGTCTVDLWLMFRCPQECGDWLAQTDSAGDSVKLTVLGVDLDIDGVDEPVEEDPGGFVALGGSRKKIMLSVLPSSVGPVTVDADTRVALYAAQTGGDPLGNHLEYQTAAQVPTQLWVQGTAASDGLHDVVLTLDAAPAGQHFADTVKFTVVGLGHIQCEGQNVDGTTIVLLKGTIYTFTAIPQAAGAGWPVGLPAWSGLASGTGEQKQVTFDFSGNGYVLTAQYGNSKTVIIDVVVPSVDWIDYETAGNGSQYDIYDRHNEWLATRAGQNGYSDPACYKRGFDTGVIVWFWHSSKDLTFPTQVQVRGDVTWWEEDTSGGDYSRTYMTLQALHSGRLGGGLMVSEANSNAEIEYEANLSTSWRYQVEAPAGTDTWIDTGDTDIPYYLILDDPQGAASDFVYEVLHQAVDWASGETSAAAARSEVNEEIYDSYEWDYDCHYLSSDFVRACWCLGVPASLHRWSRNAPVDYCIVDDMVFQRTKAFAPAGGSSSVWEWWWHQWAESGAKQFDPSSGAEFSGGWGGYEDDLFTHYRRCTATPPPSYTYNWDANQSGQSSGCEARGIHDTPGPEAWQGPPP
jgi:hypothetical protein